MISWGDGISWENHIPIIYTWFSSISLWNTHHPVCNITSAGTNWILLYYIPLNVNTVILPTWAITLSLLLWPRKSPKIKLKLSDLIFLFYKILSWLIRKQNCNWCKTNNFYVYFANKKEGCHSSKDTVRVNDEFWDLSQITITLVSFIFSCLRE